MWRCLIHVRSALNEWVSLTCKFIVIMVYRSVLHNNVYLLKTWISKGAKNLSIQGRCIAQSFAQNR